jgi:hypothetical protein
VAHDDLSRDCGSFAGLQGTSTAASDAVVGTGVAGGKRRSAFPHRPKGYKETSFSSKTDRYLYKGSQEKNLLGHGGFSFVEKYVHILFCS